MVVEFIKENIILISVLIIAIVTTIILYDYNKKVKKKLEKIRKNKKRDYRGELKKIQRNKKNNEKKLKEISELSKDFFEDEYCLKKDLTFSEISKKVKSNNIRKYNQEIEEILYSGKNTTKKDLEKITKLLEKIIKDSRE